MNRTAKEDDLNYSLFLAALRNANQYIKDAEQLINNKSYGHAYALIVFAIEEVGKSFLALECFFTRKKINKNYLQKHLYNHPEKQIKSFKVITTLIFDTWFESSKYKDGIYQILQKYQKNEINYPQFENQILSIARKDQSKFATLTESLIMSLQVFRDYKEVLHELRLDAMYVDIKENKICSPQDFILDTVSPFFRVWRDLIDIFRQIEVEITTTDVDISCLNKLNRYILFQ